MNFQDEMGRVWAAPTLVQRNCIYCHKMFLIRADDDLTFDCGRQDASHPVFEYHAGGTYREMPDTDPAFDAIMENGWDTLRRMDDPPKETA